MLKKCISIVLCIILLIIVVPSNPFVSATDGVSGEGTRSNPYIVTTETQLIDALGETNQNAVYIRLGCDISDDQYDTFGPEYVVGTKHLDLNGYTIDSELNFGTTKSSFSLFIIPYGASLTVDDSVGGGEIIYDRHIPSMDECNYQTEEFLERPLTVFTVNGNLTVNAGEITAGRYKSEYYTYTHAQIYNDSLTNAGTVNSITPGNAIVVNSGGKFTSNGGEYYGRGFTIDDNCEKSTTCAAVVLNQNATAVINAGDFYGKSNADVFSVNSLADITVFSGNFYAKYDNRITTDKQNGMAYYVNVNCGRIGIPLRAFNNGKVDYTHIFIDSVKYTYTTSYSSRDDSYFTNLGSDSTGKTVTVENLAGNGTARSPYKVTYTSDLVNLLNKSGQSKVYIDVESDLDGCVGAYHITGNIVLDLKGHTIKGKISHGIDLQSYSLFIIDSGCSLTINDSVGGGEIVYDRKIPTMGECNSYTDIILYKTLTVFEVNGNLTVNAGEITAGHYESEHYTYTKEYAHGGSTSSGSVNSVVPGTAVYVKDGGRFTSNGGEYYGRGFTIDDNGDKSFVCSAVELRNGAVAVINDGDFYGKSNANVFTVPWGANLFIYSGKFSACYDNRITVDKNNGTATYVNVDCGKIGIPLRAFNNGKVGQTKIFVGSDEYAFSSDFTTSQSNEFENLGTEGTGKTVTVSADSSGSSQIVTQDDTTDSFVYNPLSHYEVVNKNPGYFNETFGFIPTNIHTIDYSWKVEEYSSSRWIDVTYSSSASVANGYLMTLTKRLDLYDLAGYLEGGMKYGHKYRITAYAYEIWKSNNEYTISTTSSNKLVFECDYEPIGDISLNDSVTKIEWPMHQKYVKHVTVEDSKFTATLKFEEYIETSSYKGWKTMVDGVRGNPFIDGVTYRLKVQITPKGYYKVDDSHRVFVGGRNITDISVASNVLTGYLYVVATPAPIDIVSITGKITSGCELSNKTPLMTTNSNAYILTTWVKDGVDFSSGIATSGNYSARIRVEAAAHYYLTTDTKIKVFDKLYSPTYVSPSGDYALLNTDSVEVKCDHSKNTNGWTYDSTKHYITCSVCKATVSSGTHLFGAWEPQCGFDVRKCSVCDYEEQVSNGKENVGTIYLDALAPTVSDKVPSIKINDACTKYANIDGDVEWFVDIVDYTCAIPSNTVMEEGHKYYAQVKFTSGSGYYFDGDTTFSTTDPLAGTIVSSVGYDGFAEIMIEFVPTIKVDIIDEIAISGITAPKENMPADFTIPSQSGKYYIGEIRWIDLDTHDFLTVGDVFEKDKAYILQISVIANTGSNFAKYKNLSVFVNGDIADIALYENNTKVWLNYLCLPTSSINGDIDGDGMLGATDLSLLTSMILSGDSSNPFADMNSDGKIDVTDLVLLKKKIASMKC